MMRPEETQEWIDRIEIGGGLDRQSAEALQLEIRRLAQRHGVDIRTLTIERIHDE